MFGGDDGFAPLIDLTGLAPGDGFALVGATDGARAGATLAAGDVNGGRLGDLLIGALGSPYYGIDPDAAAYVVFGLPSGGGPQRDTAEVVVTVTGAVDEGDALTGDLFADNGAGPDTDPDGDTLMVSAVDGVASAVGGQVALAGGALLTVRADGTFDYDPNGAFDALGEGEVEADGFAYILSDGRGGTDMVEMSVRVDGAGDDGPRRVLLAAPSEEIAYEGGC